MAIYEPEVIRSNPYDGIESPDLIDTIRSYDTKTSNGYVYQPSVVPVSVKFPLKTTAVQTIGESFNSKTKKILGEFTFGELGSISIGAYENGVSGEVKISPNGIVAKNVNGDTTFALDAVSGDATFKGTIQAGAFISGAVDVGGGNVQIDGANKRIIINDGQDDIILIGYQQGGF